MAYRLDPDTRREVLAALDVRERGGYTRSEVAVGLGEGAAESVRALLYVATPDNPNYLGPAPLPEIAEQIRRSSGPSGSNVEYVLRLAEFLRSVDANEPHVFEIERLVLDERRKRRE
jgi:cation transport regulator ChaC